MSCKGTFHRKAKGQVLGHWLSPTCACLSSILWALTNMWPFGACLLLHTMGFSSSASSSNQLQMEAIRCPGNTPSWLLSCKSIWRKGTKLRKPIQSLCTVLWERERQDFLVLRRDSSQKRPCACLCLSFFSLFTSPHIVGGQLSKEIYIYFFTTTPLIPLSDTHTHKGTEPTSWNISPT